jgi:hypothetical protein
VDFIKKAHPATDESDTYTSVLDGIGDPSADKAKQTKQTPTEIVIFVGGMMVQGVCSTDPNTIVFIADRDVMEGDPDDTEIEIFEEAEARSKQDDMHPVW